MIGSQKDRSNYWVLVVDMDSIVLRRFLGHIGQQETDRGCRDGTSNLGRSSNGMLKIDAREEIKLQTSRSISSVKNLSKELQINTTFFTMNVIHNFCFDLIDI